MPRKTSCSFIWYVAYQEMLFCAFGSTKFGAQYGHCTLCIPCISRRDVATLNCKSIKRLIWKSIDQVTRTFSVRFEYSLRREFIDNTCAVRVCGHSPKRMAIFCVEIKRISCEIQRLIDMNHCECRKISDERKNLPTFHVCVYILLGVRVIDAPGITHLRDDDDE